MIEEKLPVLQACLAECQQKTDALNNDRNMVGEKLSDARRKEDEANAELTLAQSRRIAMTEEVRRYEERLKSAQELSDSAKTQIETKQRYVLFIFYHDKHYIFLGRKMISNGSFLVLIKK